MLSRLAYWLTISSVICLGSCNTDADVVFEIKGRDSRPYDAGSKDGLVYDAESTTDGDARGSYDGAEPRDGGRRMGPPGRDFGPEEMAAVCAIQEAVENTIRAELDAFITDQDSCELTSDIIVNGFDRLYRFYEVRDSDDCVPDASNDPGFHWYLESSDGDKKIVFCPGYSCDMAKILAPTFQRFLVEVATLIDCSTVLTDGSVM